MQLAAEQAREQVLAEMDIPPKPTPITMGKVARKYGLALSTVQSWRDRSWVDVLHEGTGQGSATYVDEHDVVMILVDPTRGGTRGPKPGSGKRALLR